MSIIKKTLKGAAIVAGIGACALLIKKVTKGSSDGYYNIDECEDNNCYGGSVVYGEDSVLEEAEHSIEEIVIEEDITENEITEEDSLEDNSEDVVIESDNLENTANEDEDKSSNPLEDEK